jgi:hypothetical protein
VHHFQAFLSVPVGFGACHEDPNGRMWQKRFNELELKMAELHAELHAPGGEQKPN